MIPIVFDRIGKVILPKLKAAHDHFAYQSANTIIAKILTKLRKSLKIRNRRFYSI